MKCLVCGRSLFLWNEDEVTSKYLCNFVIIFYFIYHYYAYPIDIDEDDEAMKQNKKKGGPIWDGRILSSV